MPTWLSMSGRIFASVLAYFAASVALTAEEEQPEVVYSTPSGAWRIERNGEKKEDQIWWCATRKESYRVRYDQVNAMLLD